MAAPISLRMRYFHWKDLIASKPRRTWDGSKAARAKSGRPDIAVRHPHIREMAEQVDLVLFFGAEPPCHRLRCGVFLIDAMDDLVEFEGRDRPANRRPRRLHRRALAAKFPQDA